MKKLIILLAAIFVLPLISPIQALAGGGGPPKDLLTGVFIQVDPATRTAVFKKAKDGKTKVLAFSESWRPRTSRSTRR